MISITVKELARVTGGTLLCGDETALIGSLNTDSRCIRPGDLFVPLKGEKFDGHDYALDALHAGAAGLLTAREFAPVEGKFMVLVPDTRLALKALASHIRSSLDIPFIAVIGSVGKTTTKDMIASVLEERFEVLKTDGNFNNDIGVPLTLARLEKRHRCAVIEMGMNHFGEIRYIAEMVRPDYVVMTNIGDAHIENLGSREGILKAKSEVYEFVDQNAVAVLNGDDALLRTLRNTAPCKTVFCGEGEDCDVRASNVDLGDGLTVRCDLSLDGRTLSVHIPAAGRHMIYPAAQAAYLGARLGLTDEEIIRGIAAFVPTAMRMNIRELPGGLLLLDDAYNANPQSMEASIRTLAGVDRKKKIAVLGDMFELGDHAETGHRWVGMVCRDEEIDTVYTCGPLAKHIADAAGDRAHWFPDKEALFEALAGELTGDCAVLVKASRAMNFETITKKIEEMFQS